MAADQARARQIEQAVLVLVDQPAALGRRDPVLIGEEEGGAFACRLGLDDGERLRNLRRDDRRRTALEDAGLLGRDQLDGVAEEFLVVDRNRRDHRGQRMFDDVGGVEPAAETDLEQDHVGRIAGEEEKSGGRGDLEMGDRPVVVDALDLDQRVGELVVVDEAAAASFGDADALVKPDEMRRRVDMDAATRGLQHGAHEGGGRSLAVGAGDMDDRRQASVGTAELEHQPLDPIERQVDLDRMQPEQPLQDGVRTFHGMGR